MITPAEVDLLRKALNLPDNATWADLVSAYNTAQSQVRNVYITVPQLPIEFFQSEPLRVDLLISQVLSAYGFKKTACDSIIQFPVQIKDLPTDIHTTPPDVYTGGGLTYHDHIELYTVQHQAALHEFCHQLWERTLGYVIDNFYPTESKTGGLDMDLVNAYLNDYKRLAAETDPQYSDAMTYAKTQLYGDGDKFAGVLALADYDHAFVSLSSWCMGKFMDGPRKLPEYMWPWFQRFFTGQVLVTPYYEDGGVP